MSVKRDLKVPMPDGVTLLADLYIPQPPTTKGAKGSSANASSGADAGETNVALPEKNPTILIRTPYGRAGLVAAVFPLQYAQQGYTVLYQSARGTGGSEGDFCYARNEHADGLATIEWIKKQEWFNGQLVLAGASYLGFVQWAVAAFAGPELKAVAPCVTSSDFNGFRYQGGTVTLESMLGWSTQMTEFARTGQKLTDLGKMGERKKKLDRAYNYLPLKEADRLVVGQPSESYQDVLAHSENDEYWKPINFSDTVKDVEAPVDLTAGWYDLFLYWQLLDYKRLREAGKKPYLLIGPWFHGQLASFGPVAKENLDWFEAHVRGNTSVLRKDPVRLFVMGANEWRDFPEWPPASQPQKWYLQPEGGLAPETPLPSEPDRYRYNPADPTPAVGGNSLGKYMGAKDNRELEAREDVLVYSSTPLKKDLEVIGPIQAELYVRSSLEYTDFFARLCVVEKSGKSTNLCDGIIRLEPGSSAVTVQEDGSLCVKFEIWPTANHFKKGQRVRLQVSSGAHPRFPRNPGSGEPIGSETTLKLADQTVYHDPAHPSSVTLPVVSGR